jgi:hypothetical protein
MLNHDKVKTADVLKPDFRKNENVVYTFEVMLRNIGKDSMAVQKPPRAKRYFIVVEVR